MSFRGAKHGLTGPQGWFSIFWAMKGWLVLILAVVCLIATGVSYSYYRSALKFERSGMVMDAVIGAKRISGGEDNTYYVTFRYQPEGSSVRTKERKVSRSFYNDAQVGETRPIRYLPETAGEFEYYVGQKRSDRKVFFAVGTISGVLGLIGLWFVGRSAVDAILARRFGEVRRAKVIEIRRYESDDDPDVFRLVWKDETDARGESLWRRQNLRLKYDIDDEITVYFRNDKGYWEGDVGPRENN